MKRRKLVVALIATLVMALPLGVFADTAIEQSTNEVQLTLKAEVLAYDITVPTSVAFSVDADGDMVDENSDGEGEVSLSIKNGGGCAIYLKSVSATSLSNNDLELSEYATVVSDKNSDSRSDIFALSINDLALTSYDTETSISYGKADTYSVKVNKDETGTYTVASIASINPNSISDINADDTCNLVLVFDWYALQE